jgi:hypothetical protein
MFVYRQVLAKGHPYLATAAPKLMSRKAAEQIAVTALGTELPAEETLLRMCQEGEATGLIWGPRQS